MFFTLSKTLNYLTMPLVVICLLLTVSALIRNARWKKKMFLSGLILLLFFTNEFIANECIIRWEVPATPFAQMNKHYKYGILLSGVTRSGIEPNDRVYFTRGADRVTHSLQLYREGIIEKILVSGGSGQLLPRGQREADQIASALMLMGIPPEDIITETTSRNTHESAMEVKSMLHKEVKPEDCLLITSAFHLRRSQACFSKVGWRMDGFSTDFLAHPRKFTPDVLFIPQLDALGMWHAMMREWAGYIAYWIAGYV